MLSFSVIWLTDETHLDFLIRLKPLMKHSNVYMFRLPPEPSFLRGLSDGGKMRAQPPWKLLSPTRNIWRLGIYVLQFQSYVLCFALAGCWLFFHPSLPTVILSAVNLVLLYFHVSSYTHFFSFSHKRSLFSPAFSSLVPICLL